MIKLFVYGTLRRNQPNHIFLQGAALLSATCWTHGRLYDTGLGYPAMASDSEGMVYGELYSVTPDLLAKIDTLEEYTPGGESEYLRIHQVVFSESGEEEAYLYVYAKNPGREEIPGGDWMKYLQNK